MNKPSPANRFESMELMRALGREWNALSDEEKKVGCSHFPFVDGTVLSRMVAPFRTTVKGQS